MTLFSTKELGPQLVKELGLPANTKSVQFHIDSTGACLLTCEIWLTREQALAVGRLMKGSAQSQISDKASPQREIK